jgi:hypothetical protein
MQGFESIQKFKTDLKPHGPDLFSLLAHSNGCGLLAQACGPTAHQPVTAWRLIASRAPRKWPACLRRARAARDALSRGGGAGPWPAVAFETAAWLRAAATPTRGRQGDDATQGRSSPAGRTMASIGLVEGAVSEAPATSSPASCARREKKGQQRRSTLDRTAAAASAHQQRRRRRTPGHRGLRRAARRPAQERREVSGGRRHGEDDVARRLPRRGEDGVRAATLSEPGFYTRGKRCLDTTAPDSQSRRDARRQRPTSGLHAATDFQISNKPENRFPCEKNR